MFEVCKYLLFMVCCVTCKIDIQQATAKYVDRACGLLMASEEDVFAVTLWQNEVLQILNYLSDRKINAERVQNVVEVTKNGKFPLKLKCMWSSYIPEENCPVDCTSNANFNNAYGLKQITFNS